MSCEDQGHVKVLARTLGAAADSLDEVAADDETRAKLWDGLSATQRKALDELVACGKRREREADDAPPPKKARKEPAPAAEPAPPAKPLEQAARDRNLSSHDRLRIIGAQIRADGASPPASAEAWDGLLARLQELDRLTTDDLGTNAILGLIGDQIIGHLLDLRNSQGLRFLRQTIKIPSSGKSRVELIQPTQPSAVEKAVAELAQDLVVRYHHWRAHHR
jgi:hypothetical protein